MEIKCPKCGGPMIEGEMRFDRDVVMPSQMNVYMSGFTSSPIPNIYDSSTSKPYWEEKTGKKTGFLIKSDEKKTMLVTGIRCAFCGYLELFAKEKQDL